MKRSPTACGAIIASVAILIPTLLLADDLLDAERVLRQMAQASPDTQQCIVTVLAARGRPAMPSLIRTLADPDSAIRALAAQAIREILAADPTAGLNDHGEAYWRARLDQVKDGMTTKDVKRLLPAVEGWGAGYASGEGISTGARLDDYWVIQNYYWATKVSGKPDLLLEPRSFSVPPPPNFTGTWTTWYINGQKQREEQFRAGKRNGISIGYFANGVKSVESNYIDGEPDGLETAWWRNGKKSGEGSYDHGKQAGAWRHWHDNGQLYVLEGYKADQLDGLVERWYPDGQKQSEDEYRDGKETGRSKAWDETGKLLWDRPADPPK